MSRFARVVTILLLAGGIGTLEAHPADEAYAAGVDAARAGAFEEAARHFADAQHAGMNQPALAYNLGVVNFRLGRLDQAATAFRSLLGNPGWRALAHYNLGLTEERRGAPAAARRHFRQAHTLATSPELRALAARKLPDEFALGTQPPPRWHGIVSLAGGHDDNVLLADDQLIDSVSDQADQFGEVIAAARRALRSDLTVDVSAYYRFHRDLDEFDFGTLSTALSWRRPLGAWQFSTSIRGDLQFAGGESYANVASHRLQLERAAGTVAWRARNDLSYLSGGSDFDFVTGWRNRTQLQVSNRLPRGRLHLGYEFEVNDRDDFESGDQFASYSPAAHGPFAGAAINLAPRWVLDLQGSYRTSSYRDDNRFFDANGDLVEAARDQDVLSMKVRLDFQVTDQWQLWSQYQYASSDSELPRYDYTGNAYLLGLETTF